MDLFTPRPSALIKWALGRAHDTRLSPKTTSDPGVLVLARGVGILALYSLRWNIPWRDHSPYDSISDLDDGRIPDLDNRTRGALAQRAHILESGIDDDTSIGRLLHDRANFSSLLRRPNAAPAAVRAALSAAAAEDISSQVPGTPLVLPLSPWLDSQILLSISDPDWGEEHAIDSRELEYDCEACREDCFTPWELVWKYYSARDLERHVAYYHSQLAQAKRYLESLRCNAEGYSRLAYCCPGWDYSDETNIHRCEQSHSTHEALADHILRVHLDDIGAALPARYLLVFAEIAAAKSDKHAANMRYWLPKMRKWATAEEQANESQQARRFQEFMERHPPSEDFWNSAHKV